MDDNDDDSGTCDDAADDDTAADAAAAAADADTEATSVKESVSSSTATATACNETRASVWRRVIEASASAANSRRHRSMDFSAVERNKKVSVDVR